MKLDTVDSIRSSYDHIYLSPHMDDAALSCGGRMAMQAACGEKVLVVTVFSGIDENKAAPERSLLSPAGLEVLRREDDAALERLGVDHLRLDRRDGVFRQPFPLMRYGLHRRAADRSAPLTDAVRTDVERICLAAHCRHIYVPLGIGQHIDHHLAFLIGTDLGRNSINPLDVRFYEEIPYVFIPHALNRRFRTLGVSDGRASGDRVFIGKEIMAVYRSVRHLPTLTQNRFIRKGGLLVALSAGILSLEVLGRLNRNRGRMDLRPDTVDAFSGLEKKIAAILDYRSQAHLFFSGEESLRRSLMRYSLDIGGRAEQYLERCWKIIGRN
jgi:LmbE family N-acetylglucosaminyl deacetylase